MDGGPVSNGQATGLWKKTITEDSIFVDNKLTFRSNSSVRNCSGGKEGLVLGIVLQFLDRIVEGDFETPCKNRENSTVLE